MKFDFIFFIDFVFFHIIFDLMFCSAIALSSIMFTRLTLLTCNSYAIQEGKQSKQFTNKKKEKLQERVCNFDDLNFWRREYILWLVFRNFRVTDKGYQSCSTLSKNMMQQLSPISYISNTRFTNCVFHTNSPFFQRLLRTTDKRLEIIVTSYLLARSSTTNLSKTVI